MKVIKIPQSESELRSIRNEFDTDAELSDYYSSFVKDFAMEIEVMAQLKGNSNIVSFEDHEFIRNDEGIGWTILIRMDLLKPFTEYQAEKEIDNQTVVKLGVDICSALELCEKRNIIHRDIKPDNIFLSEDGLFELGDFGIARELEKTTGGLSKKGTYSYMAPEVYLRKPYNHTVDLYSLGIVMYKLLNHNRTPFLPKYPKPITFNDKESALQKRIKGEEIPDITDIPKVLNDIVKKACAFNPKDRFYSASELKQSLLEALNSDAPTVEIKKEPKTEASVSETDNVNENTVGIYDKGITQKDIPEAELRHDSNDDGKTVGLFENKPLKEKTPKTETTDTSIELTTQDDKLEIITPEKSPVDGKNETINEAESDNLFSVVNNNESGNMLKTEKRNNKNIIKILMISVGVMILVAAAVLFSIRSYNLSMSKAADTHLDVSAITVNIKGNESVFSQDVKLGTFITEYPDYKYDISGFYQVEDSEPFEISADDYISSDDTSLLNTFISNDFDVTIDVCDKNDNQIFIMDFHGNNSALYDSEFCSVNFLSKMSINGLDKYYKMPIRKVVEVWGKPDEIYPHGAIYRGENYHIAISFDLLGRINYFDYCPNSVFHGFE